MRIPMQYLVPRHRKLFPGVLFCVLSASISVTANAAPGDDPAPLLMRESNPIDRPTGNPYSYLSIAGSAFHPLDNGTGYIYQGNGCIAKSSGTDSRFAHRLILPQDAIVRFMRLYYYDAATSDVVAFFTTYDGAGNYNELALASSADGPSGYGSALSPLFSFPVNHYSSAINIVVNLSNQNDNTVRFCGVRIAYDRPVTDRIFANGFDPVPL